MALGTIRSKTVDLKLYEDDPPLLMFGMFSALFSANVMLYLATAFGYPVSTTHDIVGSIMGISIAARGFDSVEWDVAIKIFPWSSTEFVRARIHSNVRIGHFRLF